jgi:ubiquitin carboxyl-terminal hydrolase 34
MWESVERRYKIDLDIKNHSDIVGGLAALMTPEEIHDFRCEHCSTVANITRSGYFRNLPPVLILHLKRFDFDMQTFTRRKIYQFCAFPFDKMLTLQVKPESVTSASVEYELTGVVVHSGSADHGHYYSFLKCPMHPGSIGVKDRAWLKFDDRCVTEFDISRAEVEW